MDEVAAKVEALKDEMVKNRRFFHSHPETGFFTFFTTAKIASELKKLGYSLKMGREIMKPEARAGLGSEKDKEKYLYLFGLLSISAIFSKTSFAFFSFISAYPSSFKALIFAVFNSSVLPICSLFLMFISFINLS